MSAMKDFRKDYFAAGTRMKRVALAVSGLLSSGGMVFFAAVWTSIPLMGLVHFLSAEEVETGGVVLLGIFLLIGLGLFGFAFYRIVSLIRTIFTAPPVGSAPAVTSGDERFSEDEGDATGTANPFRSAADADTDADAPQKMSVKMRIGLTLFGSVFFCVGMGLSISGINDYFDETAVAETWVSAPCKVVSAKIETNSGRKGRTTYSPKIVYEFSVNGKTFRGDRVFFSSNFSTSNYEQEVERLNAYKLEKTCWYNPENPEESVLMQPNGEFSLRKCVHALFGIPFWGAGIGIIALAIFAGRSRKKEFERMPIGTLVCQEKPYEALGLLGFAVFWNVFVYVFIAIWIAVDSFSFFAAAILGVFVLIGLGLGVVAILGVRVLFLPRFTVWTSPAGGLPRGNDWVISWSVNKGDPAKLRDLEVQLVLAVKTNVTVNGRPKERIVESVPVCRTLSRSLIRAGSATISVPADLQIGKWRVRLSGKTGAMLPDFKADYEVE